MYHRIAKTVLTVALSIAGTITTMAQSTSGTLTVISSSSEPVKFVIDNGVDVVFNTDCIYITGDGKALRFDRDEYLTLQFPGTDSGVASTIAPIATFRLVGNRLICTEAKSGTPISVYDLSGRLVSTTITDDQGSASIDFSGTTPGVYIVNIVKSSFKFIIK